MRTLTMNEIEEVGGGLVPLAVPPAVKAAGIIMAGAAALITATAALVTALKEGGDEPASPQVIVNCPAPK